MSHFEIAPQHPNSQTVLNEKWLIYSKMESNAIIKSRFDDVEWPGWCTIHWIDIINQSVKWIEDTRGRRFLVVANQMEVLMMATSWGGYFGGFGFSSRFRHMAEDYRKRNLTLIVTRFDIPLVSFWRTNLLLVSQSDMNATRQVKWTLNHHLFALKLTELLNVNQPLATISTWWRVVFSFRLRRDDSQMFTKRLNIRRLTKLNNKLIVDDGFVEMHWFHFGCHRW